MISRLAQTITPYTAGEQPQDRAYVKLNTNENPYPPSPRAVEALESFDAGRLRLYPDPQAAALREAIARVEGVAVENVYVGNGSDEVLALAFPALFDPGAGEALFPDVTYSFYPVFCRLYGIRYREVPLRGDFTVDPEALRGGAGVVLANPNAPTSVALPLAAVEEIAGQNAGKPVIVDEAYIDFASVPSAVSLLARYENLLVVKTFSKSYSLAGLRCGYAVGSRALISALERIRDSFNSYPVDMVAQTVAAASILDRDYFDTCRARVIAVRDETAAALSALGAEVLASEANFLFVKGKTPGAEAYARLKESGILVRHWDKPRISDYLRVTIGTREEMRRFLAAYAAL